MNDSSENKGYLIQDIIGYYRYTAESPAEAWANHMTNTNSFNNSFLGTDKEKVRQLLIGWNVKSLKPTYLSNVYEVIDNN